MPAGALPTLGIGAPADGSTSTSNLVDVNGTAAGPSGKWTQTSGADFLAGASDNIAVGTGNLSLAKAGSGIYDDFNDNSIDSSRWTVKQQYGVTASESGGVVTFSGTGTVSQYWTGYAQLESKISFTAVYADITNLVGSTYYSTSLGLYENENNQVGISVAADMAYPSGNNYVSGCMSGGVYTSNLHGNAGNGQHTLGVVYYGGKADLYVDGNLIYTYSITLNNPVARVTGSVWYYTHQISVSWDNVRGGSSQNYVNSGSYLSPAYDTRAVDPVLKKVSWGAVTPANTGLTISARSSSNSDMSAPTSWTTLSNGQGTGLPPGRRYIQYRAVMTSADGLRTPALNDITLDYYVPIKKVDVSIDDQASWLPASGREQWRISLTLPENATKVWVRATDVSGETAVSSITVNVDTTPPTAALLINWGDAFTKSADVTLILNATDRYGVRSVMFSEDPMLGNADWADFHPAVMAKLSAGDGEKTVYAKFRDPAGHESETVSDTIVLDTAPPVGTVSINDGAEFSKTTNVTLTIIASDLSGTGTMLVSNFPDLSGAQWTPFAPRLNWTLSPGNGERSVYVKLSDNLGHETQALRASILLDTMPPVLGLAIDSGAAFTRFTNATLTLTATDNFRLEAMMISQTSGFSGAAWVPFRNDTPFDLAPGDGFKTVYAKTRDAAGNECPVASDSITLDTTPPVAAIVGLPREVDDPDFTVNWSGTDPTSGIASYDIQYRDGMGQWTDWLANTNATSATFQGLADHNYSFRARARDNAGNVGTYPESVENPVHVWPKHVPAVTVSAPKAGSLATGILRVTGTAFHPDRRRSVQRVELRIDSGEWRTASGSLNWNFRLDTGKLRDGTHTLAARAFDGERYSNETTVRFRVNNLESSTTLAGIPLLLLALLIVGAAVIGAVLVARRKRPAPDGRAPLPPEAFAPQRSRPPPLPPAAPPPVAQTQMSVVGRISVDDLDDEAPDLPSGLKSAPFAEPPAEPPAPRQRDETAMREGRVLKSLSSLPRGLPSSLWGIEMEDLASKVVSGERKDSPDGDQLVKIGNRWYYADETNYGQFMQEYKKS